MQRAIKPLSGSPTSVSIRTRLTSIRSDLERAKGYIQFTRQQPQFPTFEATAKFAQRVADETAQVAATVVVYSNQQAQIFPISIPATTITHLKDINNSAQGCSVRIAEGMQAARAYTYPEAIVHYTNQVAGTLDVIATLQEQLVPLISGIQVMVDTAEKERQAIQAQQQAQIQAQQAQQRADEQALKAQQKAAKQAVQAQQKATKQATRERNAYLAQFGGIDPEEIMAHVRAGTYTGVAAGIMTHKGEIVLFATAAALAEDLTTAKFVGGSSGISVPVGLGLSFRVGSYRGREILTERLTQIDGGSLIITTQRIIFTGRRSTVNVPLDEVLQTIVYDRKGNRTGGIDIRSENRTKREVFLCSQPLLTNTFILIACQLLSE